MQEGHQGNHEINTRSLFEALNHYYLLFFALSCVFASVFLQEIFIAMKQFRLGIAVAPVIGIVLPVVILTRRFGGGFRHQLRITRPRLATAAQVVVATVVMVVVVDHIFVISQQFMPETDGYAEGLKALRPDGLWSAIVTFTGLCIIVPFAEEIVFRGFIQRIFSRNMNGVIAFVVAGVFFGVIHLSPQLLLSMSCFGVFLGFIFYATSNLTYTILSHAALNTVAFMQLTFEGGDDFSTAPFYVQEWWYLPIAAGIVVILLREIKRGATPQAPAPFQKT
jgi:membrane protease YdiL (CAAX protease family)